MNFLGHPYVAFKSVGRLMPLLVAGSHLPDLVPFVPDSVFTFEEIHESPDKFLRFLEQKHPDKKRPGFRNDDPFGKIWGG